MQIWVNLINESATAELASVIAKISSPGFIVFLSGGLGAGKTTFVRGFLKAAGYSGRVKSPTFTLVETYFLGPLEIYHFDLYRLKSSEELYYIGIQDYFSSQSICLIEWPERANSVLPLADIYLQFEVCDNEARKVSVQFKEKILFDDFKKLWVSN